MLTVRQVTRAFDGVAVLRGVDLEVVEGEILCLLGPSGSGKTSLLRVIAGLEQPDSGDVLLNGQSIVNIPVHQRGFGLMFQDFALFPHLNVAENVVFGLRMQGAPLREQQRRLRDVLQLVGLTGFERRDVAQLSGGERQRVALARSLAPSPRLLMLDEPLGSLDAALRERLIVDLRAIIKRVGLTALYVTHDQEEAYAVADRLAVMNAGVIEQVGAPEMVYRYPQTTFVARFLGLKNVLPVLAHNDSRVHTAIGEFSVQGQADAILIHPRGIEITSHGASSTITGVVEQQVFQGENYRVVVRSKEGVRLAFTTESRVAVGDTVALRVAPEMVVPLISSDSASSV
jgi:ABC-type Fe3+/spermidine/putrescine transport system ATPase subunit